MTVWLLNLEADLELERPGYQPTRAIAARSAALLPRARALLRPGDRLLGEAPSPREGGRERGRVWCPTPNALRALARAGVDLPAAPSFELLRRVNHRRFHVELGATLPEQHWVSTLAEAERAVAAGSPSGEWLLKRPFGFAGRGRRRVRDRIDDDVARWIAASADGLLLEPWLQREGDFAQHGFVQRDGELVLGRAVAQRCDERGAWIETCVDAQLSDDERALLAAATREVGEALVAAGYFGPFGIDAFRYRLGGRVTLCKRCEINARYTMGWAAGMGEARPADG